MIKTLISLVLLFLSVVVINADGDESKNEEITTASIEGFVEAVKLAIENNQIIIRLVNTIFKKCDSLSLTE